MAVKTVVIPPEAEGMKTGLFLRRFLPALPESTVRKIFSARDVRLDGVRVSRDTPVRAGQTFSVYLPASADQAGSLRIVYEDEDLVLVNKPGDKVVHPSYAHHLDSLSNALAGYYKKTGQEHIVRTIGRLDRETSGLLIFAKNSISEWTSTTGRLP